jgi:hypothetical protein
LVGVLSLAPAEVNSDAGLIAGSDGPFFLILQGSGDGDTTGQGFSLYDQILPIEVGSTTTEAAPKALVWAYGVKHSNWGGIAQSVGSSPECKPTEKAIALIEAYVGDFIEAAVYGVAEAKSTFFGVEQPTPKILDEVTDVALWPDYGGVPQVYGMSSQLVDPVNGYTSWPIDRFENGSDLTSDSGLSVSPNFRSFEEQINGGDPLVVNYHSTIVALAELNPVDDTMLPDSMEWCLSCAAREALAGGTSLTFRIGFERDEVAECVGEEFSLPKIELVLEDQLGEISRVDISDYGRLALPDTRPAADECSGVGDPCQTYSSMQATVRVPLADLCQNGTALDSVSRMRLEFFSVNPIENGFGTLIIYDDLEIHRVPGEPEVSCRCG